ncbi:hypothetical protein CW751_06355 [Brumimicrobium salinarum]|uniref:Uncharacterized protein n=1 Tax=Brumimicrobium salinarum TaxID=2058658 RepID=A0A2I0R3Q2_9FLAO|nr:hypothetical protein [Brumimicrobium salinarum]PKR81203.1 hypothetical protein CW751_06355 [Brumimicrobium salinarum]
MIRYVVILLLLVSSKFVISQSYEWKLEHELINENIEAWDVNPVHEIIFSSNNVLYKLDDDLKKEFTQSRKSISDIVKIDAQHSLKTLIFSAAYQTVYFVDNTLSFQDADIQLFDLDVGYASNVCYSNQTNRFWVFDEQNTRLLRFGGVAGKDLQSKVSNLISITHRETPSEIIENNNEIFLFFNNHGTFVFDLNGSFLREYAYPKATSFYPTEKHLYFLLPGALVRLNRQTNEEVEILLPNKNIAEFKVFKNIFYFKNDEGISKYSLIPTR